MDRPKVVRINIREDLSDAVEALDRLSHDEGRTYRNEAYPERAETLDVGSSEQEVHKAIQDGGRFLQRPYKGQAHQRSRYKFSGMLNRVVAGTVK